MIKNINSICLLRLSALGDVTHVLPVVATLQKEYPNIKLTWIIGRFEYKLMQGLPNVEFIIFDKKGGSKAIKALSQKLGNRRFDVLLHMQYSFRANRVAWKVKADKKIGFDKKRSRELHGLKLTHRIEAIEKQHVLDSFMAFLKVLGVKQMHYQWPVALMAEDEKFADRYIDKDKLNIIISPCSSNPLRNWSSQNYAKIIDYVCQKYQANVIVCGSGADYEIKTAKDIERLSHHPILNLAGKDTIKQLFALIKKADLVISPDSGPMHMSSAAQTPVIGLHAATTAKRSGAYNYPNLAIDCFAHAAVKFLNKPPEKIRWGGQVTKPGVMDLITPAMVKEKIDVVLN